MTFNHETSTLSVNQADKINRFFQPKSMVVIGGREAEKVINQSLELGYTGKIYAVNPHKSKLANIHCVGSIEELPDHIDAAFIAIPKHATIEAVAKLQAKNCAGCVCYASGFAEHNNEGKLLQEALITASADMALVGPNCYGMINYSEKYALWPDYHGGQPTEKGAAIITQSGNIGINLTMQTRGLPLAMLVSTGNQAGLSIADYIHYFATNPNITTIGIHIESIIDINAFQQAVRFAQGKDKSIVCLKSGKSTLGADALKSHTSAIAGEHHFYQALFDRLHIACVNSLDVFIETLKIHHVFGPLPDASMLSISSSGGEASLCADLASQYHVDMPTLDNPLCDQLSQVLGDVVIIQNPLDYHTFIWGDFEKQRQCFGIAHKGHQAITCKILDFPPFNNPLSKDWLTTIDAFIASTKDTDKPRAVISSFADNMPVEVQQKCLQNNIVPLSGLDHAIQAIAASAHANVKNNEQYEKQSLMIQNVIDESNDRELIHLNERQSKQLLKRFAIESPKSIILANSDDAQSMIVNNGMCYPLVVKILDDSILHKSELNGVILNIDNSDELSHAVSELKKISDTLLIEEMITDSVCELLLRIKFDGQFGAVLSVGLGGKYIEILNDLVHIILPTTDDEIRAKLKQLKGHKIIHGYRNETAINIDRFVELVLTIEQNIQIFMTEQAGNLVDAIELAEIEINPLMATQQDFIAVDAIVSCYAKNIKHIG